MKCSNPRRFARLLFAFCALLGFWLTGCDRPEVRFEVARKSAPLQLIEETEALLPIGELLTADNPFSEAQELSRELPRVVVESLGIDLLPIKETIP
jgi:hypothetical protein